MTDNLVRVVMPAYNTAKYLPIAVESALNQTYKNIEIIIINDGSTEEKDQVVQSYLRHSNVIYIKQEKSGGG